MYDVWTNVVHISIYVRWYIKVESIDVNVEGVGINVNARLEHLKKKSFLSNEHFLMYFELKNNLDESQL